MIGVGALKGAVTGLAGIAGGLIGGGARRREQKAAQKEFNTNKARMEGADTSNLAVNQENTMEDLTVNTQQADFINQQQQAGMANTMGSLQGAAGGSGIAALAQSLSNQQTANHKSQTISKRKPAALPDTTSQHHRPILMFPTTFVGIDVPQQHLFN